jgi:hypothetical protein
MPKTFYEGELGKPAPRKITPLNATFRRKVIKQGQSQNVEDKRIYDPIYVGNHLVQVYGYLTRNTWFHLASRVKYDIFYALQSHDFGVFYVAANGRDVKNSQYNFEIHLRVFDGITTQQVQNSLIYTLGITIALLSSIRIINIFDYQK